MKNRSYTDTLFILWAFLAVSCQETKTAGMTGPEKEAIRTAIHNSLRQSTEATRTEDINAYMATIPEDFIINDESGETITREMQREYALRDWSIIDTTLAIKVDIDSIQFATGDSVIVFTSQSWERLMFQRDGITKDTVLTTQRHREVWKKNVKGWFGYDIEELGGQVFINGQEYKQ